MVMALATLAEHELTVSQLKVIIYEGEQAVKYSANAHWPLLIAIIKWLFPVVLPSCLFLLAASNPPPITQLSTVHVAQGKWDLEWVSHHRKADTLGLSQVPHCQSFNYIKSLSEEEISIFCSFSW